MHEKTVFGNTLIDASASAEIQYHIQTFFERLMIDEGSNYEVEAKFGVYIDNTTNERISLPILTTCGMAFEELSNYEWCSVGTRQLVQV